ncbi:aspartate-semialdehyde dehydrogenase [Candidatus Gromoviella agglomerans]|uniref:aspartate-semialdehyde dehydrogenase n=1 Tax=Candidatus Gromoviella agglomerans TaxID=2806609 RepID=UPI001E2C10B0|nr:aspartate-semialdehyde dehydrogenase [Candidatus Gromoviella agglomerans]UFX98589.1 Aspartate-semialdehyde dehydrogenase [Candidatus Gromoviella agglomerans]
MYSKIIGVLGATGLVGSEIIRTIEKRKFPVSKCFFVGSGSRAGELINFKNINVPVISIDEFLCENISMDVLFSCASESVSEIYVSEISNKCTIVIDKTEYFRDKVDLIIPEINEFLINDARIVSSPNCVVIPLALALNPFKMFIKRVIISTYQSFSGAGMRSMSKFRTDTDSIMKEVSTSVEDMRSCIAASTNEFGFNVIPNIGLSNVSDGVFSEERKIVYELQKILGVDLPICVTCVRVPSMIGHGMSVNVELYDNFYDMLVIDNSIYKTNHLYDDDFISIIKDLISQQDGVQLNHSESGDSLKDCLNTSNVLVSRLRRDFTLKRGFSMWVCCDNLQKGAALNAVQIAECKFNFKPELS